jgi:hypothetical protein
MAAEEPLPVCGSPPVALPPQTNCACAGERANSAAARNAQLVKSAARCLRARFEPIGLLPVAMTATPAGAVPRDLIDMKGPPLKPNSSPPPGSMS